MITFLQIQQSIRNNRKGTINSRNHEFGTQKGFISKVNKELTIKGRE